MSDVRTTSSSGSTPKWSIPADSRVLVVDPSHTIRVLIRKELDRIGCSVFEADSLAVAVQIATDVSPHVITLPSVLPDADVSAACQSLVTLFPLTPLLIITSNESSQDCQQAFEAGAVYFLQKQSIRDELSTYLRTILKPNDDLSGSTILVVEDSSTLRLSLKLLLESCGATVVCAEDGMEGLKTLESNDIDVVLTDHYMPNMTGIELVQSLRQMPRYEATPIIVLSASSGQSLALHALEVGATDFIRKPYEANEFLARVRSSARLASANRNLRQATRRADAANRAKSEFLATMSHELRTPIAAILGFNELLRDDVKTDTPLRDREDEIETIRRNGQHLLALIDDILDTSKIESGRMEIERTSVDPVALVREAGELMQNRADVKGLEFRTEFLTSMPPVVESDPVRLRQVLLNIMSNAIKFTQSGSVRLNVSCMPHDENAVLLSFDCVDTGVGLDEEDAAKLFEPFTQASVTKNRQFGGTGLGLTISRHLARAMGGDLSLVKSQPGVGSHFRFTITARTAVNKETSQSSSGDAQDHARTTGQTAALRLDGVRILLAEDGPDNRHLIVTVLRKAGAVISVVENGREAFDATFMSVEQKMPFDVILMDMQMPVMDGYSATRLLRSHGYKGSILALTANAMAGDRQKCLDAGCDEYHAKPIDRKKLIAQILEYRRPEDLEEELAEPLLV